MWLTQAQMATSFGKDKRTISEHISNLFKEAEFVDKSVVQNFRTAATNRKSYDSNHSMMDKIKNHPILKSGNREQTNDEKYKQTNPNC